MNFSLHHIDVHAFMLVVQVFFAGGLAWSCFCRLVKCTPDTIREIRWTIWLQAVCAGLVMGAPFLPGLVPGLHDAWPLGTTPWWIWLCVLVASALMQWVTAKFWRPSIPAPFRERAGDWA